MAILWHTVTKFEELYVTNDTPGVLEHRINTKTSGYQQERKRPYFTESCHEIRGRCCTTDLGADVNAATDDVTPLIKWSQGMNQCTYWIEGPVCNA
jgi:hypothetical protein